MKKYIFTFTIFCFFCCESNKKTKIINTTLGFVYASNCVCDSLTQKKIETSILQFTDTNSNERHIKVFKVLIGRRYDYTRINVFPAKFYDDWENDLPCSYKKYKNYILLFYNGNEKLLTLDSGYQKKLRFILSSRTQKELNLYNPPVLQIDFYSTDSMIVNLPARNPLDFDCEPQIIYDFSPPKRKKK